MNHRRIPFRTTLAAAAVIAALPAAHVAQAQAPNSAGCNSLLVLVDEAGDDNLAPNLVDARSVATRDDANECSLYVARVQQVGSIELVDGDATEQVESDTATETVQIEQEATIEGEVRVTLPDPQVEFESAGEPDIEVISSGEPMITIHGSQDEGASLDVPTDAPDAPETTAVAVVAAGSEAADAGELRTDQRDPGEAFAADPSDVAYDGSPTSAMLVSDLDGMEVINGRGEDLGEVERVVRNGENAYIIVEHGGWFLGLNDKEVAFPIENLMVRGDSVVLRGMTDEQIAEMPDYDFADEIDMGTRDELQVMRVD